MIREMERRDWKRVSENYTQGLQKGVTTFEIFLNMTYFSVNSIIRVL